MLLGPIVLLWKMDALIAKGGVEELSLMDLRSQSRNEGTRRDIRELLRGRFAPGTLQLARAVSRDDYYVESLLDAEVSWGIKQIFKW